MYTFPCSGKELAYTEQPRSTPSEATSSGETLGRRLDSWKEIASYLNRKKDGHAMGGTRGLTRSSPAPRTARLGLCIRQLDAWLESRSHLGSHGVNSAGEPFSNVAAEAEPEEENNESPSSRSSPKSWGESLRLRLTASLLWMLPQQGDHGPTDPPAKVGVRTKSRVWARVAVVGGFVLLIGAALLHYGGWQARPKPSPESGSLVRAGTSYGNQSAGFGSPSPAAVPLTSDPGDEIQPSFSPDGDQVAYAFSEGNVGHYIWVKTMRPVPTSS